MSAICHKTAYASRPIALAKIHQVNKNRLTKGKYNEVSKTVLTAEYCKRGCNMWHIVSSNGKGVK